MIVAVDLAAKFSAACHVDPSGVVWEDHSWGMSESDWIRRITEPFSDNYYHPVYGSPEILLIEDVPFNVGQTKLVKAVYQLQGRIIHEMSRHGQEDSIVLIPPQLWQKYFPGVYPGNKKVAAQVAKEQYGYEPPQLLTKSLHGKDRVDARKSMEDHVDAYLIAQYMLEMAHDYGSVAAAVQAIPRLERYGSK